tara:strand:+ start:1807 stop:2580 length:774 start_codon:yes stop_codon:yes gene_type:complete
MIYLYIITCVIIYLLFSYDSKNNYVYNKLQIYTIPKHEILQNIDKNIIFIVRNFTSEFNYLTPEYLINNYSNQIINAHTTISEQYERKIIKMTLANFFKRYNKESLYIKEDIDFIYKTRLHKRIDIKMRNYFTNLFLRYYFIWIGSKGTKTGLHKDGDDQNYLLQLYGNKRVILFRSDNDSKFKIRKEKEGGASLSSLDYWKDRIDIQKKEIVLNPGDILSIPCGWWHCAENLNQSIAISCRSESMIGFISKLLNNN